MSTSRRPGQKKFAVVALAVGVLASAAIVGRSVASDHQDTPEVEFNPRRDVNDVYVFPSPASPSDRVVLVMTTASPLTPADVQGFGTGVLYQIKIDNTGDAVEDLVLQFKFSGRPKANEQTVSIRGPVAPEEVGTENTLVNTGKILKGPTNTVLGSPSGMQVFAGQRDDPFFLDLERFFRIIPDRKPERGPLSRIPETPTATRFRDPGVNFFTGINANAIVVELPESELTRGGTSRIGVWGTTSVARGS